MSQPSAIAIPIKLDDHNYHEWASVKIVLRGNALVSHMTGVPLVDKSKDSFGATEVKNWKNDDGRVISVIVTSMKESLIMSREHHKIAKKMWYYLQRRYVQNSGALLHTLMIGLHGLQQNDLSIDEYYIAFDRLMGPLLSMVSQCTGGCSRCCD